MTDQKAEQTAMLKHIMDSASVAIAIVDRSGRLTHVSRYTSEMFGWSMDELIGSQYLDHVYPSQREIAKEGLTALLTGRSHELETERLYLHKDGSAFWGNLRCRRFHDTSGNEIGIIGTITDIDKRKKAENALRESEERYRTLFEEADDHVFILELGPDNIPVIIDVNSSALRTLGYSREELIGKPISMIDPDQTPETVSERAKELAEGDLKTFTVRHKKRDGSFIHAEVNAKKIWVGAKLLLMSVERDITDRMHMEERLQQSELKFRKLYNETPVLLHSINREGIVVDVNDYWLKTLGYERDEVIGRKVTDFYTPASKKYAEEVIQPAFFRDGVANDIPYQFVRKNGEIVDVLLSATGERDGSGNVVRSMAVIRDVTDSKSMEEKSRQYSENLKRLLTVTTDMSATTDQSRLYRVAVQTAKDLLHFDFSTLMLLSEDGSGLTIMDTVGFPGSVIGEFRLMVGQGLSTHVVRQKAPDHVSDFKNETRFEIPPLVSQYNIRSALCVPMMLQDNVFGVLIGHSLEKRSFSPDDTALFQSIGNQAAVAIKNAFNMQAVAKSERMLQTIIDTTPDCIKLTDSESRLIMMNRAGLAMLQVDDLQKVKGQFVCPLVAEPYRQSFMELTQQVFKGDSGSLEFQMTGMQGVQLWLETHAVPLRNEKNDIIALLGVTRDITERKRMEQELLRAQKLESIGTLAGGIAHDFNNLLQGVFGYISMAKLVHDQKDKSLAMLEQAEKALHQSVSLSSQLLTFSKGGKPVKKLIHIGQTIENAVKFALSGSNTAYQLVIADDLRPVEADEGQIAQVIQNIVLNASEAMSGSGTVEVSAANLIMPGTDPKFPAKQGPYIRIDISDNGTGIPEQNLEKIFDPYFSTKQRGSGLGLATSYSIIRNHNGIIDVKSQIGMGTTFSIFLPASEATGPAPKETVPHTASSRRARILLMDDEKIIRDVASEMIRALGHDVETVQDGRSAVDLFRLAKEDGRSFDLVILDLTIKGGMGGEETISELIRIDPNVKAVVSSGYSDNAVVANFRDYGFSAFLNKPYRIDALKNCLDNLIG